MIDGGKILSSAEKLSETVQFVKKLTAIFCDGLFSVADEATASLIISKSIDLCRSERALSQLLQIKFISEHTPFYWVIVSSGDGSSYCGIPPLLEQMLQICGDLDTESQEDIKEAFLTQSNDAIFQYIKSKLPNVVGTITQSFFGAEGEQPTIKPTHLSASDEFFSVSFDIPRLFDRIVVDHGICHAFTVAGSIWYLRAAFVTSFPSDLDPSPLREWCFELAQIHSRRTYKPPFRGQHLKRQIDLELDTPRDGEHNHGY
ncbi:hypothetical protein D9611_013312 [Ephemerocybe angulata]|uniref:Uncharacterized protein n=1 Tax=Ephemerocybe angulata TaxID=980116 RepID=A0A8H5FJ98_9AGAR|nr:hypothetical protein D9611_013312 [Tulosesus angulatus]